MSEERKRGVPATEEGRKKLREAKAAGRNQKGKPLTYEDIAEMADIDSKTVKRFFSGQPVDRGYADAICRALGSEPTDIIDPNEWNRIQPTHQPLDWQTICHAMLEKYKLRQPATEQGFELEIYVPLGLMERKEQQRRPLKQDTPDRAGVSARRKSRNYPQV